MTFFSNLCCVVMVLPSCLVTLPRSPKQPQPQSSTDSCEVSAQAKTSWTCWVSTRPRLPNSYRTPCSIPGWAGWRGDTILWFSQHDGVGDGHNSEAGNKFPSADGWESPRYDASEAGAPENPEEDLQEQRNPPVARGNNQVPTPPVDQNQKANVYEDGMYWRTLGLDHH